MKQELPILKQSWISKYSIEKILRNDTRQNFLVLLHSSLFPERSQWTDDFQLWESWVIHKYSEAIWFYNIATQNGIIMSPHIQVLLKNLEKMNSKYMERCSHKLLEDPKTLLLPSVRYYERAQKGNHCAYKIAFNLPSIHLTQEDTEPHSYVSPTFHSKRLNLCKTH